MNAKQLIAAIAVLATIGSAFAIEAAPSAAQEHPVSVKIRAVIRAEAVPARTEGPLASGEVETTEPAAVVVKSRVALHINARPLDTVDALRT